MDGCIFCKIASGEIESAKIYEDEHVIAFLDIVPCNPGHVLVVPKQHHESFSEMNEEEASALGKAALKVAKAIIKATGFEDFNLLMNNGIEAGQEVMHAHLHIMPRTADDEFEFKWQHTEYATGEKEKLAEKIKQYL